MPAEFDACVAGGGRVRTKKLGSGKYMHICFKNGKSYAGEVKMVKSGKATKGSFMRMARKMSK